MRCFNVLIVNNNFRVIKDRCPHFLFSIEISLNTECNAKSSTEYRTCRSVAALALIRG